MPGATVQRPVQKDLVSTTTTALTTYFTEWVSAVGMDVGRATMKVANASGNIGLQFCIQVAETRTDIPSAPTAVGSVQSSDGEYYLAPGTLDLASVTPGKAFIRFGVQHKVSTGSQGQATVTLQVATLQCGMFLPAWRASLGAVSAEKLYVPISGWMATVGVAAVEAVYVISSVTGDVVAKLTFRTATTSTEAPSAWNTAGLATLAGEDNTGEISMATPNAGSMWVQIGIMYYTTGTAGNMDLSVLLGIRLAA